MPYEFFKFLSIQFAGKGFKMSKTLKKNNINNIFTNSLLNILKSYENIIIK